VGVVGESGSRDVSSIRLPRWGRVEPAQGQAVPWRVVDPDGHSVEPIAAFLRDFTACGNRPDSVRSYAYGLLRWWRWLQVVKVDWDKATSTEVRELVLWLGQADKPRRHRRTASSTTAGTMNAVTGKRHLDDSYAVPTVRHSNAVLRRFYEYWIESGHGPLVNPVPLNRRDRRPHAHHNPLKPFAAEGGIRYNPKLPKRRPRAIPDERWDELFSALRCDRDRALATLAVSSGARAGELLGLCAGDVDWGEQRIRVIRKGSRGEQWLPASSEAFVWLRLYLAQLEPLRPNDPLWWTVRRRDQGGGPRRQRLNYEALRAVFRRINAVLGSNYSMHDLRHTAALRMSADNQLSMRDVQTVMGHAHLSTTGDVYLVEDDNAVLARVHEHLTTRDQASSQASSPLPIAAGYDRGDLDVLFGQEKQ